VKNKALVNMIKKHGGKVLPFRKLPSTAKYAMAHYMSIDGEAWKVPKSIENGYKSKVPPDYDPSVAVVKSIGWYTKYYGNRVFGLVNLPTDDIFTLFHSPTAIAFHKMQELYEDRKQIWPIILDFSPVDEFNVGPIQDGWHRFTDYVTMGLKEIPCLYYP
jgi:hypothetical protein